MECRSATVRGIASLLALCGAAIVGAATLGTWYYVSWSTGGVDITFHTNFDLYQLMSRPPSSNSVSGALVFAGLALMVVSAIAELLPNRAATIFSIIGLLVAVALITLGSLTVGHPQYVGPFGANGNFAIRGVGLRMALLGAALGLVSLLVFQLAPHASRQRTTLSESDVNPVSAGT